MLQIKDIRKEYRTGELVQKALDGVTVNLRDNEFVAVLGPSGSGKTTLLNIVGGLDRYDSGDLIINGISTKKYSDHDWDSYRNHTIGFVFQNYNLILHQSILANVELALTISGVSRGERRERAKRALEAVGLGDQLHKRPSQMSGGQMQRVAIARALVNDPDILLADEPTGALDTETSLQVMELLKEVAKDRLVVMVTHNPELAESYATRIIRLRDGRITDDSDPYDVDGDTLEPPKHENMGKASMSFRTALSLSFNNLRTKKGRTILTAFAGSIGIIGIALILSLSNGVNNYFEDLQKSTMTSYPISIAEQSMDITGMASSGRERTDRRFAEAEHPADAVYADSSEWERSASETRSAITSNNLTAFKRYLDDPGSAIRPYIGESGVIYSYDMQFDVYAYDPDGVLVNTDGSTFTGNSSSGGSGEMMSSMMSSMTGGLFSAGSANNMEEMMAGTDGALIGAAVTDNYDLLYGSWPESYDEVVLVLDKNNEIEAETLYELGILPAAEYREIRQSLQNGGKIELSQTSWNYDELCGKTLWLIPACDHYVQNANGLFDVIGSSGEELDTLLENAIELTVVGVIRPAEDASYTGIGAAVGYTNALTEYLIEYTENSPVVRAQLASPDTSVLNGAAFDPADDVAKVADTKSWLAGMTADEKAAMCREILTAVYSDNPEAAQMMLDMTDEDLAGVLDTYVLSSSEPDDERLLAIYGVYVDAGSYEENMTAFGYVDRDNPTQIDIYADSFEDKEAITACIADYNAQAAEDEQVTYTDFISLLTSSVTTIINVISYVLIAFVAVSLIVSSIMIGIITYISVLERTKEIGILRAIGASKRNISQVFNAETCIVGLLSGLIGVGVTLLLLIPGNAIVHSLIGSANVSAALPIGSAALLIVLSVILTLLGGLIPSKKAARKDPVAALRSE